MGWRTTAMLLLLPASAGAAPLAKPPREPLLCVSAPSLFPISDADPWCPPTPRDAIFPLTDLSTQASLLQLRADREIDTIASIVRLQETNSLDTQYGNVADDNGSISYGAYQLRRVSGHLYGVLRMYERLRGDQGVSPALSGYLRGMAA